MLGYISKRALLLVPIFLGVTVVAFTIMILTPGDPVLNIAGQLTEGDPELIEQMRQELGLDQPAYVQYGKYLWRLVQGDLGRSIIRKEAVSNLLVQTLPATLILIGSSMAIAIVIGIPIGVISSTSQRSASDHVTRVGSIFAASLPDFWLGIMLILVFSYYFGLTPTSGYGGIEHVILPALTLGIFRAGLIVRLTRSSMLEVIRQDYIRAARARGLKERVVTYRHALRNALLPIVTILGLQFGYLMSGAFFVEWVFAWPGIGRLTVLAITQRDYPVVMGALIVTSTVFVLVNLIVDIVYAYIDPRVQYK